MLCLFIKHTQYIVKGKIVYLIGFLKDKSEIIWSG